MRDRSAIEALKENIASIEARRDSASARERRKAGQANDAFGKLVAILNAGDRSEKAVRARLAREGFESREIDDAVSRAKRCGIIDDMRYADVLIRSRISQGRGAEGIVRELGRNDIDVADVEGWPFEYGIDDETERQRALSFLQRHPSRSKNRREGAYRKLVQRGFSASTAADVARKWAQNEATAISS